MTSAPAPPGTARRRVLVTGSTEGIGAGIAARCEALGHEVVRHARSRARADALAGELGGDGVERAGIVVGDLADPAQVADLAAQVRALGPLDAVVHNAGWADPGPARTLTPDGLDATLAVNVLAVHRLLALAPLPDRVVHVSSDAFRDAPADPDHHLRLLTDLGGPGGPGARGWTPGAAYASAKLVASALVAALARRRPDVVAASVHPGWVRTRMSAGTAAPLSAAEGADTPAWLAVAPEVGAQASGGFFASRQRVVLHPLVADAAFGDRVVALCEELTGLALPTGPRGGPAS